ncbi:MAG TPA: ferritin-like domain-containing protein [Candidatus Limnocylindrales bacterium]|nr:ferritin-like domain-containing protein [Candidatus Limnocylindrales bacterium]
MTARAERPVGSELTKTMCAPWMYDFRECFCFYWAASKPDVVEDGAGRVRYVNFLRNRARRTDPPPLDTEVDAWERMQTELTQTDLVEGWWHELPVVLDDREQPAEPRVPPPSGDLLDRDEAIAELRYLATVEHALIVEFLYAAYSVKAERRRPPEGTSDLTMRIWSAADQVFRISIDEMRHFLWVNMILRALGAPPSTGRAAIKGEEPRGLRKATLHKSYLDQKFSLEPLTPGTIERFIQIERPSQEVGTDLDGMYVGLLASIVAQPRLFPEGERIAPIVKLLIDEGQGHYRRFDSVRQTLDGIAPERYLRPLDGPPTPLQEQYLALGDEYYQSIMEVIEVGFRLPAPAGDMLVREAVRSMENLDDVARRLAAGGVGPRFTMPEPPPPGTITAADAMRVFSARRGSFDRKLGVMAAGEGADVALIARHRTWSQQLVSQLTDIVNRPPEP